MLLDNNKMSPVEKTDQGLGGSWETEHRTMSVLNSKKQEVESQKDSQPQRSITYTLCKLQLGNLGCWINTHSWAENLQGVRGRKGNKLQQRTPCSKRQTQRGMGHMPVLACPFTAWFKRWRCHVQYLAEALTLILSASIDVLASKIVAFSTRLGWLTPGFLSRRKPAATHSNRHMMILVKLKAQTCWWYPAWKNTPTSL